MAPRRGGRCRPPGRAGESYTIVSLPDAAPELVRPVQHEADLLAPRGGRIRTGGQQAQESLMLRRGVEHLARGRREFVNGRAIGSPGAKANDGDVVTPTEMRMLPGPGVKSS